ncbi:PcfJ domain-containing protein [Prosthecobacter sp.]|uniref:PcfJ domain-containing protein n=1 Tax=Prosthecobacter sp. TaxID=1965333 RepID=UPI003782DBC9
MNLHHGRAAARPQAPVMPAVLSGRAWTARLLRNNCFRQHCHAAARSRRVIGVPHWHALGTRLLAVLETRSRVLFDLHPKELGVVPAIVRLAAYAPSWVRHPEDWQPDPSQHARAQWASFLRHLLALYPVPEFLDSAWHVFGQPEHFDRDCWIAVAQGRSLKDVHGFPSSMKSRVLHAALNGGDGEAASLASAVWRAELDSARAQPALRHVVLTHRLFQTLAWHALGSRLVEKFAAAPADAPVAAHFPLVVDALHTIDAHQGRAHAEQLLRLPIFALMRHAVKFVTGLMRVGGHDLTEEQVRAAAGSAELLRLAARRWRPMLGGIPFESRSGWVDGHPTWRVEELCTTEALKAEARAMRHCVSGYTGRCHSGKSAIFSVRFLKREKAMVNALSLATIEVAQATRSIIQIKAPRNTSPGHHVMRIINEWASSNHLEPLK